MHLLRAGDKSRGLLPLPEEFLIEPNKDPFTLDLRSRKPVQPRIRKRGHLSDSLRYAARLKVLPAPAAN